MTLEIQEHWAYDLNISVLSKTEIFDKDVINFSIQNILSTSFGERLFVPNFGSSLPAKLYESFSNNKGERIIDEILKQIELWEDRVVIEKQNVRFIFSEVNNSLEIFIPFLILQSQIRSYFNKKIILN